jgi:hypothetical protein
MAIKHENNEFLASPLKQCIECHGAPKQYGIAYETAIKCENDEFLASPLKLCIECRGPLK